MRHSRNRLLPALFAAAAVLSVCLRGAFAEDPDGTEFFETRIRPVLIASCFKCHGGTRTSQGLRVNSRAALLAGGDTAPAVVPGKPGESLLIQAIRYTDDDLQMPPDEPLSKEVVADFVRWVEAGAPWPKYAAAPSTGKSDDGDPAFRVQPHWAFRPVQSVDPPPDSSGWSDHPIDRFIAAKWSEKGLHPVGPATPRVLARRLTFDLIGLPPDPGDVAEFERDFEKDADGAIGRLIDRLLASPRYGERWGRHWMDVVRYADTAGDNADYPVPEARLYRDYIIDAFNADKPYDEFVREQVAGDLLAQQGPRERYAERVTATGFLALSRRYGTGPYEFWHLTLEDTIDTFGKTFLGLTLRCARCHDHKFDPVTKDDYYALYGVFSSTQFPWAGAEEFVSKKLHRRDFVPLIPDDEAAPRRAAFEQELKALAERIAQVEEQLKTCTDAEKPKLQEELNRLQADHFNRQRSGLPPDVPGAYAVRDGTLQDVAIQIAGDPGNPGPVVPRGGIAFLTHEPLEIPADASGRLQLVHWLTRPDNPLTARVIVNRVWQQHFGRGIVGTPSNFGTSGSPPTHPKLLDYLAARFVESGWSIKTLHRLILTSHTWQLSSDNDEASARIDTGNAYLWRHNRRRLEAEAVRDAMLAVSGTLDLQRPGPHPFPPFQNWNWTQHNQFKDRYETAHRSVYLMTQRIQRHPFLALFDGPDTNTTTGKRTSATVPPQALYLMNGPETARLAAALADRLLAGGDEVQDRVDRAHRLCYGRPATDEERRRGADYVAAYAAELSATGGEGVQPEREAWTSYARILLSSNEFFYVD